MRLWVDTDVGTNPDDAIALLLACAHPAVELVGVSTTGGDLGRRTAVARALLDATGAHDVPAITGPDLDASMLVDVDALLAIGPLTNIARVVPALPETTVMGGALAPVDHRGATRHVESNFAADPRAAAAVLAELDLLLVPLDVTARMRLDDATRARLAQVAPAASEEIARWRDPVCLHDPLALLAALGEPVVRIVERRVAVDGDGRVVRRADARVQRVVEDADVEAAIERIVSVLADARR
ncbi:MAG TPA: nucleoside hydrolase [Acidimicrobiia bacterium]|nr:nucleoside hydrolase [Acidimicrobiia bacterium]